VADEPHPSSAAIIDLYVRHANVWIERRGGTVFETPWIDRFRALLPQHPEVLDLGCGSGRPMARALADRGCQVTGVDASEPLLAFAQSQMPDQTWICADMRGLKLGRRFDGILAWHSLFHLAPDDQRAMFPVFHRHARPGAALMFTSGASHGERIGEWEGEALYHASLSPDEYRDLLAAAGFDVAANVIDDPDCGNATVWLARRRD
jgi:SAM-dependent methyltransferase